MKLTIIYNNTKEDIELTFTGDIPKELDASLRALGFRKSVAFNKKWSADKHPAYINFATALKEVLVNEGDWKTVQIQPSFESSLENIDQHKFSYVTIHVNKKKRENFVVFDSYKKVATAIASHYAMANYGADFKSIQVSPRNFKRKARILFEQGKVIPNMHQKSEELQPKKIDAVTEDIPDPKVKEIDDSNTIATSNYFDVLSEVISELLNLEEKLTGESETIIGSTLFDLEEALEITDEKESKKVVLKGVTNFRDWASDLNDESRYLAVSLINKLIVTLDEIPITSNDVDVYSDRLSFPKSISTRDKIIPNVLVPTKAKEPFQSGGLYVSDAAFLKQNFPELYTITDTALDKVSPIALFQLAQMAHPKDYGMLVNRSALLREWEARGPEAFTALGYPTDLDYPYVNINTGYKSVSTLGSDVRVDEDRHWWWSAVEHSRPVADLAEGVAIIDELLMEQVEKKLEHINPKTNKPKTNKQAKDALNSITWEIDRLERSKEVIKNYQNKKEFPEQNEQQEPPKSKKEKKTKPNDYLDKVIAVMHIAYTEGERLSKKRIEKLKKDVGAPTMGALWEAVELSWLLWYKMIYKEPIPFEARLKKMVQFWNNVQPTYAYSDSSKELYKQYSTPCPIGAIIAQYTGMKDAEFIFEPSAGNGLLLVGADPKITHVNEIDQSRKKSLEHQGFVQITSENAAEPFADAMEKVHDVVVTNPPFAKWEAPKFDKDRIATKYFNGQRGVASHIRLEHLMSGLALRTMKDQGRAAIIIMGHVYFGEDGLLAKYRPFFNWLYRFYYVDDIINMNSFKLYNKQGAVTRTMLILVGGRKMTPGGVAPNQSEVPHLDKIVETFEDLWEEVKLRTKPNIDSLLTQLKHTKST